MSNFILLKETLFFNFRLADSMDSTFTNPFEIVTDDVIFGLDTVRPAGANGQQRVRRDLEEELIEENRIRIPKYNNFMKKVNISCT